MSKRKPRVIGLGGFFVKSRDPATLGRWYVEHLGVPVEAWNGWAFPWRDAKRPTRLSHTVWSLFKDDTSYFSPSVKPFMFNFQVADLDAVRAALIAEGVEVDPRVEDSEYGRFGWCMDPEGNRIELWQPPDLEPARRAARRAKNKPAPARKRRATKRRRSRIK
jgi:catechol 2,3-dioxygenase-like lactoylglutathione lyase family enzyme